MVEINGTKQILMLKVDSSDDDFFYVGHRQFYGDTFAFLQHLRQPHTVPYDIRYFCWEWVSDAIANGDEEIEREEDKIYEAFNELSQIDRPDLLTFDEAIYHANCFDDIFSLAVYLKEMTD